MKENDKDVAWFPKYKQFKGKPKEAIKYLMKVKKVKETNRTHIGIGFTDKPLLYLT